MVWKENVPSGPRDWFSLRPLPSRLLLSRSNQNLLQFKGSAHKMRLINKWWELSYLFGEAFGWLLTAIVDKPVAVFTGPCKSHLDCFTMHFERNVKTAKNQTKRQQIFMIEMNDCLTLVVGSVATAVVHQG